MNDARHPGGLARARSWTRASLALSLLSLGGGCLVVADGHRHRTGYLSVDWSIEGSFDPYLCAYHYADALEVVVYDRHGYFVTEVEAVCEAFSVSIELYPGTYFLDVTLVGFYDEAITTTQAIDSVRVVGNSDLILDIDFPPISFL